MNSFADVIAAVSTPPGKGGVAIIRISGKGALALSERFFFPKSKKSLGSYPPRTQIYGYVTTPSGERIDDGMATYFEEGKSYTGEETVEISSHGGTLVTTMVLECALLAGARLAEAGEFTRRAFVNGKITLSDAEAIGSLLDAESRDQVALFSEGARSRVNAELSKISNGLTEILSSSYARIDYPDEDLGDFSDSEVASRLIGINEKISALIGSYRTGSAVKDGIKTVILGKPNAGKSTLYNAILGYDAAIVTDIKGTTTDVLESVATLGRVKIRLSDTAGLRDEEKAGTIEKLGIGRTKDALSRAELVLAVFDSSVSLDKDDFDVLAALGEIKCPKIAILNKADVRSNDFEAQKITEKFDTVLSFSGKSPEVHLDVLRHKVEELFTDDKLVFGVDPIISSARVHAMLISAKEHIDTALEGISYGLTSDLVASDVERALRVISEADGKEVSEALTNDIFSRFCVGK